jgi:hypothetical protein
MSHHPSARYFYISVFQIKTFKRRNMLASNKHTQKCTAHNKGSNDFLVLLHLNQLLVSFEVLKQDFRKQLLSYMYKTISAFMCSQRYCPAKKAGAQEGGTNRFAATSYIIADVF